MAETKVTENEILTTGWNIYDGTMPTLTSTTDGVDLLGLTDADDFLQKGAKVKITSTAGTHYYYVSIANSTGFSVNGETSVTGTITALSYSYADCPFGFKKGEDWYKSRQSADGSFAVPTSAFQQNTLSIITYDPNSNISSGTYTAPISGYYAIEANSYTSNVPADWMTCISVNGNVKSYGNKEGTQNTRGSHTSDKLYVARGKDIEHTLYQASGVSKNMDGTINKTYMAIQFTGV